ncbi:MAG TPA: calcium-binding protein [Solirubrobacteraceae bacterium]|nr:calcium-binding protein [Solirubrobacteraceae bacterium]
MARDKQASRARKGTLAAAAAVALLAFPAAASAAVNSTVVGGVLTVTSTADDAITITCDTNQIKVNGANPTGPGACNALTSIVVNGGPGANAINLAGVTATAFPLVASVTINGGDGNDTIAGSELVDSMHGGNGDDRISGDDNPVSTQDDFQGEAGDDTLVWNPGDDDDVMEGGDGNDTIEVNGGGGPEQFTVKPSKIAGRVEFDRTGPTPPGPFNLDIGTSERLDMNAGGGDDSFTADGALNALGFALDVDGGDGNDSIDGGDGADVLGGGNGDDRIVGDDNPAGTRDDSRGGAGNDTMVWNPGDDDDINEGGDGIDTTEVNGGGGPEQFEVNPSSTPGRVSFDRTGPTPPGPFNVDIGTTENLRLNAGGGDDRIRGFKGLAGLIVSTFNGDDGNDRIRGTDGEDRLAGGNGNDRIKALDKAADTVECDGGIDFALVDHRDTVRGCELVLGGRLKVALLGKAKLKGDAVALRLRCVATERCKGKVKLRRGGKTLGSKQFNIARGHSKAVKVKLNARGRRLAAGGKDVRVKLRIDARDRQGNGWRTTAGVRLAR